MPDMAGETVNPLIPLWYDIAFSFVPLVLVGLMLVGLVSIVRRYRTMSVLEAAGWTAIVVVAPVLGAVIWFTVGRARYTTADQHGVSAEGSH